MGLTGRVLRSAVLGLAAVVSAGLGLVFPVPPPLLLSARRRIDRTELIRPAAQVVAVSPSEPVPTWLLDRSSRRIG